MNYSIFVHMKFFLCLFLLFLIYCFTNCKIADTQVIGTYIEPHFGDTLIINTDKSYEYIEKLNSGSLGWTKGNWEINGPKIRFTCDHNPLVAYQIKVRPDTSINNFQIKLLLNDSETPININQVNIFNSNTVLSSTNYKISGNIVRIFVIDFDSIVLKNINLNDITFPDTLNKNQAYIVRIYPVERLYELDKVPFRIYKNELSSIKSKKNNEVSHYFKRIIN